MSGESYTAEQAAERLKLHPKTVLRMIREGRLKAPDARVRGLARGLGRAQPKRNIGQDPGVRASGIAGLRPCPRPPRPGPSPRCDWP